MIVYIIIKLKLRKYNNKKMQKFKKIDQYQLMEIIGKGANGLVYKGLNITDGSLVAIKELFIGKS